MQSTINALAFPHPPRQSHGTRRLMESSNLLWLTADSGERIPALYVKRRRDSQRGKRILVLYSHGNAEDLTELLDEVNLMAQQLDADVMAYEYIGYSIADGKPSEAGCYASAAAAYAWAVSESGGGAAPHEIVPFGRSLGSAPACHMASTAPSPVCGLVLQSPLLSGGNALLGRGIASIGACLDILKNYDHIQNVRCRVAICHGTVDRVVPCWNGRMLHQMAAEAHEPLWCEGRGHNDMDTETVLIWARRFLDHQALW